VRTTSTALSVLGVMDGPAHTELKLVGSRAFVIETHTRSGGDRIPFLQQLVTGLDQDALGTAAQLRSPLPDDVPRATPRFSHAGVRYFCWPTGVLEEVSGLDRAHAVPGVVDLHVAVA